MLGLERHIPPRGAAASMRNSRCNISGSPASHLRIHIAQTSQTWLQKSQKRTGLHKGPAIHIAYLDEAQCILGKEGIFDQKVSHEAATSYCSFRGAKEPLAVLKISKPQTFCLKAWITAPFYCEVKLLYFQQAEQFVSKKKKPVTAQNVQIESLYRSIH